MQIDVRRSVLTPTYKIYQTTKAPPDSYRDTLRSVRGPVFRFALGRKGEDY